VSWPLVRGYGSRGTNKTALPLNYGRGLLLLVAVVWLVVGVVAFRRLRVAAGSRAR